MTADAAEIPWPVLNRNRIQWFINSLIYVQETMGSVGFDPYGAFFFYGTAFVI